MFVGRRSQWQDRLISKRNEKPEQEEVGQKHLHSIKQLKQLLNFKCLQSIDLGSRIKANARSQLLPSGRGKKEKAR